MWLTLLTLGCQPDPNNMALPAAPPPATITIDVKSGAIEGIYDQQPASVRVNWSGLTLYDVVLLGSTTEEPAWCIGTSGVCLTVARPVHVVGRVSSTSSVAFVPLDPVAAGLRFGQTVVLQAVLLEAGRPIAASPVLT